MTQRGRKGRTARPSGGAGGGAPRVGARGLFVGLGLALVAAVGVLVVIDRQGSRPPHGTPPRRVGEREAPPPRPSVAHEPAREKTAAPKPAPPDAPTARAAGPAGITTARAVEPPPPAPAPALAPVEAVAPPRVVAQAAALGAPSTGGSDQVPRVAIVIDDCGQRTDLMRRAVRLRYPMTYAIIPRLPHSRESSEIAFQAGQEVILHQPMEPESSTSDPGDGAILTGMKAQQVARILRENLADVPHVVGVNNHMGSRATSDPALMGMVLAAMKGTTADGRGLFFLDSRTTAQTVAFDTARRLGVPTAQRAVFLDDDLSPAAIRSELDRLLSKANELGEAVGIGHLKPETLNVLEAVLPTVSERECRFVFLSSLVR